MTHKPNDISDTSHPHDEHAIDPELASVAARLDRLGAADREAAPDDLAVRIAAETAPARAIPRPQRSRRLVWSAAAAGLALLVTAGVLGRSALIAPTGPDTTLLAAEIERDILDAFDLDGSTSSETSAAAADRALALAASAPAWLESSGAVFDLTADLALAHTEMTELESALTGLNFSSGGSL